MSEFANREKSDELFALYVGSRMNCAERMTLENVLDMLRESVSVDDAIASVCAALSDYDDD